MKIPVFFTFNNWYTLAAEVAFYSLLKNGSPNNEYALYVLSDDLSDSSKKRLERIVSLFPNASIEFKSVSNYKERLHLPEGKSHFSGEMFYKLIAADVFPEYDRILCSDVDVVFEGDISPAYNDFPNEDFYFAGTTWFLDLQNKGTNNHSYDLEEKEKLSRGIRAGFLLLNLKKIRNSNIQQIMSEFYLNNFQRLELPEQDTIALCCYPHLRYLHWKYCVLNYYYTMNEKKLRFFTQTPYKEFSNTRTVALSSFYEILKQPVQLHYVGPAKPWNHLFVDKQLVWLRYAFQAGVLSNFLLEFPKQFGKTLGRYSVKRFIRKTITRLFG
jgi:lipopolysaccharide biosynthesis glycosyltransferase